MILKYFFSSIIVALFMCSPIKLCGNEAAGAYLVLNSPVNAGFGAIFSSVLSALNMYDQGGYAGVHVDLNSGIYLDPAQGPNWWEYFFEPIDIGDKKAPHYIFSANDVAHLVNQGFPMPRERGYELIKKYIHLKPHLQKEMDAFITKNFKEYVVIGIHHRGTDKKLETPIIPYDTTLFHLNWLYTNLSKKHKVRIFVATDDSDFLAYVKKRYPKKVIYNDFVRSVNGEPLHYNDDFYSGNYQKGKEAVLDCLILSKCDWLVFPAASAFSMASLKFNPNLPAIPLP